MYANDLNRFNEILRSIGIRMLTQIRHEQTLHQRCTLWKIKSYRTISAIHIPRQSLRASYYLYLFLIQPNTQIISRPQTPLIIQICN